MTQGVTLIDWRSIAWGKSLSIRFYWSWEITGGMAPVNDIISAFRIAFLVLLCFRFSARSFSVSDSWIISRIYASGRSQMFSSRMNSLKLGGKKNWKLSSNRISYSFASFLQLKSCCLASSLPGHSGKRGIGSNSNCRFRAGSPSYFTITPSRGGFEFGGRISFISLPALKLPTTARFPAFTSFPLGGII